MTPKIPYIIYLIGVLILIMPVFLTSNLNAKIFFKNIAIWSIVLLVIIFIYQIFILERG